MTPILPIQWTQTDSPEKWTKPRKQDERTQSVLQADASYINEDVDPLVVTAVEVIIASALAVAKFAV